MRMMGICPEIMEVMKAEGRGKPLPDDLTVHFDREGRMVLFSNYPYDQDKLYAQFAELGIEVQKEIWSPCG